MLDVGALVAGRAIGEVLAGRFRLDALIGPSEHGCVYRAAMLDYNSWPVAVRVIPADERFRERFLQFGPPIAGPTVLPIYDWRVEGEFGMVAMQLVEPKWTLADLMSAPLAPDLARHYALQVLSALGSVHGDLRPRNVFLMAQNQLAVADFAIRRSISEPKHTRAGTVIRPESIMYTAPERLRGHEVDGRSDIYSLGALIYQMVAGRPPFKVRDNMIQLAAEVMTRDPEKLPPSPLAAIALNAMNRNPDHRMSGADMWQALSGV